MKRLIYLTAGPEGSAGSIYAAVSEAAQATGYVLDRGNPSEGLRGGWLPNSGYVGDLRTTLRESDLVIAHLSRNKSNFFFELGMAAGVGTPIVLIVKKATVLPVDLLDIPFVTYEPKKDERARIAFSLREIIKSLRQRTTDELTWAKLPYAGTAQSRAESYTTFQARLHSISESKDPIVSEGSELRRHVGALISSIDGWDIQAAAAPASAEAFDFVIWNNIEDSRLLPLSNPIAVELKKSLTSKDVRQLGHLAQMQGLRSVIVFTDATLTAKQRVGINAASAHSGALIIVLDRDDIEAISHRGTLLERLQQRLSQLRLA